MVKILVLEDETAIREFIEISLRRAGYDVRAAANGPDALALVSREPNISVALLDVMLPGDMDGFEVCRRIREQNKSMGIIILTAKVQEMDKVTGLMLGADDYVTKPFSITELLARIDALCRRLNPAAAESGTQIVTGRFRLDLRSRLLYKDDKPLDLTQIEFLLIRLFFENRGKALSREEILNAIWGSDYFGDSKIVDVNLRRLRLKIEDDPSNPVHLVAVWGFGYKWVD
jgi:DNA-binding response OmpR family regulator